MCVVGKTNFTHLLFLIVLTKTIDPNNKTAFEEASILIPEDIQTKNTISLSPYPKRALEESNNLQVYLGTYSSLT